ncbi:hypothetical protein STEG23_001071 [Scotinomys teguina]
MSTGDRMGKVKTSHPAIGVHRRQCGFDISHFRCSNNSIWSKGVCLATATVDSGTQQKQVPNVKVAL